MKKIQSFDGIMYSTDASFSFDNEQATAATLEPKLQNLRLWLETKHRGGKAATIIKGYIGTDDDLQSLSKILKNKCGTGGTAKEGEIIIQGDHRDKLLTLLTDLGYKAKKAGG
jgi:translation initiation factor 1